MASPLAWIGHGLARYLSQPSKSPSSAMPGDPHEFRAAVRTGDVVLVDGRQRISSAIKYLTQSTWSHAALCVAHQTPVTDCAFVEADALDGVRIVGGEAFDGLHIRICRPVGLGQPEIDALCDHARARVGHSYDLRNVVDLARYLFPTPPVPARWRRRMLALGSGEPTKAICSGLIAQAFQSIRYPILPIVTRGNFATIQRAASAAMKSFTSAITACLPRAILTCRPISRLSRRGWMTSSSPQHCGGQNNRRLCRHTVNSDKNR
jgi:hypothetical protein